jgi:methyl-accepting chemotaxis protein
MRLPHVADIMSEITAASQGQNGRTEQVHRAISQMDQVTQQNAALVEQASAAVTSMVEHTKRLFEAMKVLNQRDVRE